MTYKIVDIDLSIPRVNQVYNLTGDSIKVLNATSDCFIQFEDTTQDPINLILVDEIKIKFTKFYISNVGIKNQSIKIIVSENFNFYDRIGITEYINSPAIQVINIRGSEPNVQVELDLKALNFNGFTDNGSNIRITDENHNPLPFYLDSFNKSAKTGKLFFKTPNSIINSAIIYPDILEAPSVSDGNATFEFFDDFKGTAIDATKWRIINSTGWSVVNGELRGSNTSGRLLTHSLFSSGVILEIKSKTTITATGGQTLGGFWNSTINGFTLLKFPGPNDFYRNNDDWNHIGDMVPENVDTLQEFIVQPTTVNLKITQLDKNIVVYNVVHINSVINEPIMIGRRPDNRQTCINQPYETFWDWLRVRKVTAATAVIV